MPASRATAFDRLAPDQRAAVELVLRQGRSYGELSDLLGMPEETIRTRARGGLAALAPDLPTPARSGEIADWLLGQQSQAHAERTARAAAGRAGSAPLGRAGRRAAARDPRRRRRPRPPDRPRQAAGEREGRARRATKPGDAAADKDSWFDDDDAADESAVAPERDDVAPTRESSSRLGGALLIGAALAIVAVVLAFVFTRGTDEPETSAGTPPTATATPSTTAVAANQVLLRGPGRVDGRRPDGALPGQRRHGPVRDRRAGHRRERGRPSATRSGSPARTVSRACSATCATPSARTVSSPPPGPGNDDTDEFLDWLQTYQRVAITQDEKGAKEPGKVILSGDLPTAAAGG